MKTIKKEIVEALRFYIEENKENFSPTAVSKMFKIDKATLLTYIRDDETYNDLVFFNGVYYLFDSKEYEAIDNYLNTDINFLGIRKKYGYKQETFQKKLEVLGYPTDRKYKLQYNRDKLSSIETEEDAYVLGFILADGYINNSHSTLRIKLQEKDLNILQKICKYFEMDSNFIKHEYHQITGNKAYYISVYNGELVEQLKKYNLFQGKSCKEIPYYNISPNLIKHYIRGIFDGDGHISKNLYEIGVCGSDEVLKYIDDFLTKTLNLEFKPDDINVKYEADSHIYRLRYHGENKNKVAKYLYKNATIYLDRKYALYTEIEERYYKNSRG